MKKLVLSLAAVVATVSAFGQGAILMNTAQGSGLTAGYIRFTNTVTGSWATNGIVAGLYWGVDAASATNLVTPLGQPLGPAQTATAAQWGFILGTGGGSRTTPRVGVNTFFQIRAWSSAYASFEEAFAAALTDSKVLVSRYQGVWGNSPVAQQVTTATSAEAAKGIPWGGTSTAPLYIELANPIPEPSVIALGVLGLAGAYFIRRRK